MLNDATPLAGGTHERFTEALPPNACNPTGGPWETTILSMFGARLVRFPKVSVFWPAAKGR